MAAPNRRHLPDPSIADLIAARPHLRFHAMDGLLMEDVPLHRDRRRSRHARLGLFRRRASAPATAH